MKKCCYLKLRTHFKGLQNPIVAKTISKLQPFISLFSFSLTKKHDGKVEIRIKVKGAHLLCLGSKKTWQPEPFAWACQVILSNTKFDCKISQQMPPKTFITLKFSKLFIFVGFKYFLFFFPLKAATCITPTMTSPDQILVSFGATLCALIRLLPASSSCRLKPTLCLQGNFYLSSLL